MSSPAAEPGMSPSSELPTFGVLLGIDKLAAQILLQTFLDSRIAARAKLLPPPVTEYSDTNEPGVL